ncbi:MAG: hypothetical protein IJV20_11000 [Prevotella sp.]|nr:hypothetical protein [Prevotella sp.]
MYTKISLSGFERFFTAICIAISAINLIVSFLVAGYWYSESTAIPYTVLVICNFILLEVVLYSVITGMSGIGSLLDKKSKKNRKDIQENSVSPITIAPKVIEPATTIPAPVIVKETNPIPVESVKEESVPEKPAEESHASEPTLPALQPSVERDDKIMEIISRSAKENEERRTQFIEMRKEIMEEYVYWAVAPLLDKSDLLAFWLEYKQWIESPTYQPKKRIWKWKEKVTSRDVRHLTWNIAKRMGMDKGYSTKTCGRFIKTMFPELCLKRDGSQCTEDYLANNLLEEKDTDFIKIDKPEPHSIAFHIRTNR